jgi:hypothetical protein
MSLRPIALTLTCAAALAACGGDDRLSADEYREQGNEACKAYEQRLGELSQPSSLEDVPGYADDAQAELTELIDTLDELQPPDDLEQKHNELVRVGRQSVDALGDLSAAGESGEQEEVQKVLRDAARLDQRSDELSRSLGLTACADES